MFGRVEPFEASNSRNGIVEEQQQRNWRRIRADVLREDGAGTLLLFHNPFHRMGRLVRLPRAWVALALVGFTCVTSNGYSVTAAIARQTKLGKEILPSGIQGVSKRRKAVAFTRKGWLGRLDSNHEPRL